jgi:D-arginine dehydrogenase
MATESTSDVIVIGAGIAAASAAYWLSLHHSVSLVERESQPGYHSTGRSAALFMESYGTPQVRALTQASRAFLESPPAGFSDVPLLTPRGALVVGSEEEQSLLDRHWQVLQALSPRARRLDRDEACAMVPVLRPEQISAGVHEPDAADIDVHALHHGFLRQVRRRGGRLFCDAEVVDIERAGGLWRVRAGDIVHVAPVVVNAAGAWCDAIARMAGARPIGLVPKRRSAFVFAPPPGVDVSRWPMFFGVDETWYVKPDAGLLLGSPANTDPTPAQDVQPEELDIAMGIDRIEAMTTLQIARPTRTWAGLRSFVADGDLVGGFDLDVPGFFWIAAQGGYGIQTSAAMGEACAALVGGRPLPEPIAAFGVTPEALSPGRLRRAQLD